MRISDWSSDVCSSDLVGDFDQALLCGLEERHDLVLENLGQRIGPAPLARRASLRGEHRFPGDPITRRRAEPRLRGRGHDAGGLSQLHEEPNLMIVDMATRHSRHTPPCNAGEYPEN